MNYENFIFKNINTPECRSYVWQKATIVEGYDPNLYRKDIVGAWIAWDFYGQPGSPFGWVIDYTYPRVMGGTSIGINLRPLHYKNNQSKGGNYPNYRICVVSEGNRNVNTSQIRIVNEDLRLQLEKIYK